MDVLKFVEKSRNVGTNMFGKKAAKLSKANRSVKKTRGGGWSHAATLALGARARVVRAEIGGTLDGFYLGFAAEDKDISGDHCIFEDDDMWVLGSYDQPEACSARSARSAVDLLGARNVKNYAAGEPVQPRALSCSRVYHACH